MNNSFRRITVEEVNGVTLITLDDERIVEESINRELGDELMFLVENQKRTAIAISFLKVAFIGNNFLNKLILVERAAKAAGGKVVVYGLRKEMAQIFSLTRLDKLFPVKVSRGHALEEFPAFANET